MVDPPKFTNGWLASFQLHNAFRSFQADRESGDVRQVPDADLQEIRAKIQQYPMDRYYNYDETSLFYRVDRSIAAQRILGAKKDKLLLKFNLRSFHIGYKLTCWRQWQPAGHAAWERDLSFLIFAYANLSATSLSCVCSYCIPLHILTFLPHIAVLRVLVVWQNKKAPVLDALLMDVGVVKPCRGFP